jgi:hypothetical protein
VRVFISYARADRDYVERLAQHLTSLGYDVWYDQEIVVGEWASPVQAELDSSDALVVIMTPDAQRSEWVAREIHYAEVRHMPIYPLLLRGQPFFQLVNRQIYDVTGGQMPAQFRAQSEPPKGREIFICYRRDDSAGSAGRLRDALAAKIGEGKVFFDADHIAGGQDFVDATIEAVSAARVVLVVIGSRWLAAQRDSRSRLHERNDHVRREIETARKTQKRIIPVLVDGAAMPTVEQLPSDLAWLARLNAKHLTHLRFHTDIADLVETIK